MITCIICCAARNPLHNRVTTAPLHNPQHNRFTTAPLHAPLHNRPTTASTLLCSQQVFSTLVLLIYCAAILDAAPSIKGFNSSEQSCSRGILPRPAVHRYGHTHTSRSCMLRSTASRMEPLAVRLAASCPAVESPFLLLTCGTLSTGSVALFRGSYHCGCGMRACSCIL